MINIVHIDIHCSDLRKITAVSCKAKFIRKKGETQQLLGHQLIATVSAAFYKTTLLTDEGVSLRTALNPKRNDIVDVTVILTKDNDLSFEDVTRFVVAFQVALDNTKLF